MYVLLNFGGIHAPMGRKRSLHNRKEPVASCPEAWWDEGGPQAEMSADWPSDFD